MSKLDIPKKLSSRKGKPANKFTYGLLTKAVVPFLTKPLHIHVTRNVDVKTIKGPFIVVSNHTSRCDYLYAIKALKGVTVNFMASYTEFFRKKMKFIFDFMHLIPKKNFVSDMHAIKEMSQILKANRGVLLYPEGKSSISGTNQPIMMGTGKMFKHFNVPVYAIHISGGYLSNTQWNIATRSGKVEVTLSQLFTPEDTQNMSVEELEQKTNEAIYNDDFEWNRKAQVKFKGNETICDKLEEHLYLCPKCGKELTMHGSGNVIKCSACGNGAKVNEYDFFEPLDENCVIPKDMRVWYELQRRNIYRQIRDNDDFRLDENVLLGVSPTDHYIKGKLPTSEIVGKGVLHLDKHTFSFKGERNGEPFEFSTDILNVPTVVLETDSSYFGSFVTGEYLEFHPEHKVTTKWLLAVEECHRAAGGKWVNNLPQQQWIYEDDKPTDKENYYL